MKNGLLSKSFRALWIAIFLIGLYAFTYNNTVKPFFSTVGNKSFDDFKAKPYYKKIFDANDQKKLEKANDQLREALVALKEYQTLISEAESYTNAASTSSEQKKYLKKAEKVEKKAVKSGKKSYAKLFKATDDIYEVYSRNMPKARKVGNDRFTWAANIEKDAKTDYDNSRGLLMASARSEGKEQISMCTQSYEYQRSSFEKMEKAFGIYSGDGDIKEPITYTAKVEDSLFVPVDNGKEENIFNDGDNTTNTNTKVNKDKKTKSKNFDNMFNSKSDSIMPLLGLSRFETSDYSDAKNDIVRANIDMSDLESKFNDIDSLYKKMLAEKDKHEKENIKKEVETARSETYMKYNDAIYSLISANEKKYNIYQSHIAEFRAKVSKDKDKKRGKDFEAKALTAYQNVEKMKKMADADKITKNKTEKLLKANEYMLQAIQNQENTYRVYLKENGGGEVSVNNGGDGEEVTSYGHNTNKTSRTKIETKTDDDNTTKVYTPRVFTYSKKNPKLVAWIAPKGIVFKVQIGAFKEPVDVAKIDEPMMPITCELIDKTKSRYLLGEMKTAEGADAAKANAIKYGYKEAFVVAYINGVKTEYGEVIDKITKDDAYKKLAKAEIKKLNEFYIATEPTEEVDTPDQTSSKPDDFAKGTDVKKIKGIIYTVQLGTYYLPRTNAELHNVTPILLEKLKKGSTKYYAGNFKTLGEAQAERDRLESIGFSGPFVVSFNNGKQVKIDNTDVEVEKEVKTTTVSKNKKDDKNKNGSNIAFKIQIGAYSDKLPSEKEKKYNRISNGEKIESFLNDKGLHVYTIGSFDTYDDAMEFKKLLSQNGINDGFVVAFKGTKKIPIKEAIKLQK